MEDKKGLTEEALDAHLASMQDQPWWGLVSAELGLPRCPVCGDRQMLTADGAAVCESVEEHPSS